MNPALLFLLSRSFWNALVFRLNRLRKPKYLFGALFGTLYIALNLGRLFFFRPGNDNPARHPEIHPGTLGIDAGALLLFAAVLLTAWIWPGSRAAISFSEAEIAWLFPAPLSRPALVRYKLIKSQIGLLFTGFFFTLISGRFAFGGAAVWRGLTAWWLVLTTYQFHRIAASFALQRFRERGLSDTKRRLAFVAGVGALGALLYDWGKDSAAGLQTHLAGWSKYDDRDPIAVFSEIAGVILHSKPGSWLLAPFRLVVAPWFAHSLPAFLNALWPAALILILHYLWVVGADVSFEEASIALSQKRAALLAARERGENTVRRAPTKARIPLFTLRPTGSPLVALLWQSILRIGGLKTLRFWAAAVLLIYPAEQLLIRYLPGGATGFPVPMIPIWLSMLALFGSLATPQVTAVQLRRSTEMMDLLKSYPLRGWQMILGFLSMPLLLGLLIQWSGLCLAILTARSIPDFQIKFISLRFASLAALLLPGINLVSTIVPCGATLLLPAWFKSGRPGVEASGLRLLLLLGQLIAFSLAIVPAGAVAGLVFFLCNKTWHATIYASIAAEAVLLVEGAAGILLLGILFDRFDVTEET